MEKEYKIIKTEKGYLKGSKGILGGSEPDFTNNWEKALFLNPLFVNRDINYYRLENYKILTVKAIYTLENE